MSRTDYHIFTAIADTGGFAAAADELNMTPSALSKRLSRLEDRLGHRLMQRTTRSLRLTEKGEVFLEHCRALVAAMAVAENEVAEPETEIAGVLRIRIIAAYASRGFLPLLQRFQTRYPRVVVKLIPDNIPAGAEVPDIDVRSVTAGAAGQGVLLEPNPWVICAAPSYLGEHAAPKEPNDLLSHRCLCLTRNNRVDQEWVFSVSGKPVKIGCQPVLIGSGDVIHAAAREGMGVARLASFLVQQDLQAGRLVPLLEAEMPASDRAIYAFAGEPDFTPAKARAFLGFCRQGG